MSNFEHSLGNAQTVWTELSALTFETLEQINGAATIIRFRLHNERVRLGDVLVIMDGSDIRFHGMITLVDEQGWAVAEDRRGSSLPSGVQ